MAGALVLIKEGGQTLGDPWVIDEARDFEVMFEATEVHVRRTDRGNAVIDHEELRVEEALSVLVDLHPSLEELGEVRIGSEGRQA